MGLTGCGKTDSERQEVSGHDFQSCRKWANMNVGFSRWGTLLQFSLTNNVRIDVAVIFALTC
jgi:hypothetical protein